MALAAGSHHEGRRGGQGAGEGSRELGETPKESASDHSWESSRRKWAGHMENLHLPRKSPPLGSPRGQVEALMLGSTLGSQTRRSREMPETTPRRVRGEPERAGGHQSPGVALSVGQPCSPWARRTGRNLGQKAKKKSCVVSFMRSS